MGTIFSVSLLLLLGACAVRGIRSCGSYGRLVAIGVCFASWRLGSGRVKSDRIGPNQIALHADRSFFLFEWNMLY